MQSLIKIQYLYIEANELIESKKYYAASQKLEEAMDLFKSVSDISETEEQLRIKIERILSALQDYMNPDSIQLPSVTESMTDTTLNMEELLKESFEEFSLEEEEQKFGIWDAMNMCFEPIRKTINRFVVTKFKID